MAFLSTTGIGPSTASKAKFHAHLVEKVDQFQKSLGSVFKGLSITPPENIVLSGVLAKKFKNSLQIGGMVYPQQLDTFTQILKTLLRPTSQGGWKYVPGIINIDALTQSGKTGLINLCGLLPPLIRLLTGKILSDQDRFLTNHLDLEEQTKDSAEIFTDLYKHIVFQYNKEHVSLSEYDELLKEDEVRMPATSPLGNLHRTSPSKKPEFRRCLERWEKNSVRAIIFVDESDARSNTDSVMADMLRDKNERWLKAGFSFIGLSATNDALRTHCKSIGGVCLEMLPEGVRFA